MPRATLHLSPPDPGLAVPLFAQIANAITDHIRSGRLAAGDVLPGTRALAGRLGVDRDTVIAAYGDLESQGLLTSLSRTGTVVADPPRGASVQRGLARQVGFALDPGPPSLHALPGVPPGAILLAAGVPDLRLVPAELIARAYRRAMRRHASAALGYTTATTGHPRLRGALAHLVRDARGIAATADDIMITRGSQMALDLVARAIVRPGDVVCVEALGYRPSWAALERAGARLVGVPVDAGGIDVDALARICARTAVRLLYVTPHHQYPTTVVLTAGRRARLLALARRHRIAILEDDYDHEFHYEGRPVLPLATMDRHGVVVYIGTLSKILAPGLRLGFVVAPRPLIDRLARERFLVDRQGDHALELAIAELIEDDELGRHTRKMRRIYHARRDALAAALRDQLGDRVRFLVPTGGIALWVETPGIDADRWYKRGLAHGVVFQPGSTFSLAGKRIPAARFGYAACTEAEIRLAVRRLAQCIRP
ncbi:MAG TPA: PLP-dependent aminotransferase family protein [Kofleriaceae bacterium]|jgi:GntR family transcriptional regulator/MocR family aminotransferase|nr:PLP-dependent aminotransferase family protein [Kofleriaceae bacterium]